MRGACVPTTWPLVPIGSRLRGVGTIEPVEERLVLSVWPRAVSKNHRNIMLHTNLTYKFRFLTPRMLVRLAESRLHLPEASVARGEATAGGASWSRAAAPVTPRTRPRAGHRSSRVRACSPFP